MRKMKKPCYLRSQRIDHGEILLNNYVDKEVQKILMPLNILQRITFCPKYRIKSNFITPNDGSTYVISFILTILFIVIKIANLLFMSYHPSVPAAVFIPSIYCKLLHCYGFAMNFIVCIWYSEHNIKFVLTFSRNT